MTEKVDLKVGDRARLTIEGEVTSALPGSSWIELDGRGYAWSEGIFEILQKPLAVGDEVTEENKHLLPDRPFIVADRFSSPWTGTPDSVSLKVRAPFRLVHVHKGE